MKHSSLSAPTQLKFPLSHIRDPNVRVPITKISKPIELGSYSIDNKGNRHVPGILRKYKGIKITLPLDLSIDMILKPDGSIPEHLFKPKDHSLDTLQRLLNSVDDQEIEKHKFHFVTFRYNLNRIMETPYNRRDEWSIGVWRSNEGTIYLDAHVSDDTALDPSRARYVYWGYKFEDLVTEEVTDTNVVVKDNSDKTIPKQVDPNEEFCAIMGVTLGRHRLLVGAEIDCYEEYVTTTTTTTTTRKGPPIHEYPHHKAYKEHNTVDTSKEDIFGKDISREETPPTTQVQHGSDTYSSSHKREFSLQDNGSSPLPGKRPRTETNQERDPKQKQSSKIEHSRREFMELKTSRLIESSRQDFTWRRYKLLRYWIQSFLVGVPHIMIGFRDDEGKVHRLDRLPVKDLPKMAGLDKWNPYVCMAFTDSILDFLQKVVKEGRKYTLSYETPFEHVVLDEIVKKEEQHPSV